MIEPTQAHNPDAPTLTSAPDGSIAIDAAPLVAPAGYELDSLIGEGAMGVVYRARELAMDRFVAVKFLRNRFSPESAIGRRFVEEARITGQLQHPGIPPVHHVGTLPDGRPFLAMKLIRGRTLDLLLKERVNPVTDRGRYLAIFEQIAQAVGYAHAHSVIHRDLKPGNIMVGDYGEVQVMDWGLAKVLDDKQPTDEPRVADATLGTEIRSLREGAEATQAGSLLGTPAFMPPEQAIGAVDQIAERSDVFGLGAILCVILSGSPPFVSETAESTRIMAARAKLDDAFTRLDSCGAELELIALAKRCLAAEPGDRPKDAGEVAQAISTLRADAEKRARQAEMERARAEVRSAEERKRRRVQRVLAMTILMLIAVAGFAAWWIESVRADRRADQLTREAEQKSREAELLSRQLATERDVVAALNETQVLREEGWKQADDTQRWALTLTAARSSLKRAESLLKSGESTDELRVRVGATGTALSQDDRDCAFLIELDRIGEENDFRFLMPVSITSRLAERYANAFRVYGVDLLAMPTSEAVAWLKGHRFGDRLTEAVRIWERARPLTEMPGLGIDFSRAEPVRISPAIAGEPAVQALLNRPSIRGRLKAILKDVTDDPFTIEWLDALARRDAATIKKLFRRPEFSHLSSRQLSSLAEKLWNPFADNGELVSEFLAISYDRFPGEYWVNLRLATLGMFRPKGPETAEHMESIRYLTAAVAARPRSAMPRVALGIALLELRKDDPKGIQMLRGASVIDPTTPWPYLFLGFMASESGEWANAFGEFREAVRVDPDISYYMIFTLSQMSAISSVAANRKTPTQIEFARWYDDLIAIHPEHAGGYVVRGAFRYKNHDYRLALADYRKAKLLTTPDNPLRALLSIQLHNLEAMAQWEQKLPVVLRGELRPANAVELVELAQYCSGFEKKNLLAVRFATDAFAANPNLFAQWMTVSQFAGWAVQAANGMGVDATNLSVDERSQLRHKALAWLRESKTMTNNEFLGYLTSETWADANFAPVRDSEALAKLPPDERAEWTQFWNELPKLGPREVAPPPREVVDIQKSVD
jgi:eukaryotic-like serine/threonine-protein kinase